ncbi:MAG: hypothetical protein IPL83_02655 [Bdellovibrionales bacterium]|nr:hypothetical protein [Bdellovibrionales bacterium]
MTKKCLNRAWVRPILGLLFSVLIFIQAGCATHGKSIAGGMFTGAIVGAGLSNQLVYHGKERQYETQDTIVGAILLGLITGGALYWHYQEMEDVKVEMSGKYARYRLCDPEEMQSEFSRQMEQGQNSESLVYQLPSSQIGKFAITLDDDTRWTYPIFRKRFLQPERGELEVISKHSVWEIIKPGRFITRTQDPQYFLEEKSKDDNKKGK